MTPDQNKIQIKGEGAQMGHTGTQTSLPSTLLSCPCLSAKGGATPTFSLQIAGCEHWPTTAQPYTYSPEMSVCSPADNRLNANLSSVIYFPSRFSDAHVTAPEPIPDSVESFPISEKPLEYGNTSTSCFCNLIKRTTVAKRQFTSG